MGEKVERISGSFFRGFTVGGANILPVLTRRIDSLNTPASVDAPGPATYTAAQIGRGIILRDSTGGPFTDTLPTAALLIAGVANVYTLPADGDSVEWEVRNVGNQPVTLAAGAGLTLLGDTVLPAGSTRVLTAIRTGSSAATVVSVNPFAAPNALNTVATSISANSDQTYTAAQIIGGYISRGNAANRNDTTATAAQIVAALPSLGIGSSFDLTINADSTGDVTVGGGVGVTIIGGPTISAGDVGVLRFVRTKTAVFKAVFLS